MRDWFFHLSAIVFLAAAALWFQTNSHADLLVFTNGDFKYGKVTELPDRTVILEASGTVKYYKRNQIIQIAPGIDPPANGEIVSVSNFHQIGGAPILDITGPITRRTSVQTIRGKTILLDVEVDFAVPVVQLFPMRYSFYNRRGCFMAGLLINSSTRTWNSIEMRAHLYDSNDRILSSKDFYIYRIPRATEKGPGQRKFEINFPDVPYEQVNRMRLIRKF